MVNKVILIGRLGRDPEVRRLESGAAVAKFSIATDEYYKDKDGNRVQQTEWHNIVLWRGLAERAEKFLKKGMLIYVEGKLTHRDYLDKDNVKRYVTEVVANNFQMLERKDSGVGTYFPGPDKDPEAVREAPETVSNNDGEPLEPAEGDLPF